jgi:hypothetical protein
MVMGPAELAFALGFDSSFVDDVRLGYHTGRKPDFIVTNSLYRDWHARSALTYPDVHAHIRHVLTFRYVMVFRNSSYSIYRRSWINLPPR